MDQMTLRVSFQLPTEWLSFLINHLDRLKKDQRNILCELLTNEEISNGDREREHELENKSTLLENFHYNK